MIDQAAHPKAKTLYSNWLYKVSSMAAVLAGGLLAAPVVVLGITVLQPASTNKWLRLLQDNWLTIIFKLHAGFSGVQSGLLDRMNVVDVVILALSTLMYVGLSAALRKTSRVWSIIAFLQPILGIVLFIVTKTAGRSSFMGAELVISLVMLRSKLFNPGIAHLGMLSAVLLLAGDLGASRAPSTILAIVMSTGYVLVVVWSFLVGIRLLQLDQDIELE